MRVHPLVSGILQLQACRLAYGILLIVLVEVVDAVCEFDVTSTLNTILRIDLLLRLLINGSRRLGHHSLWVIVAHDYLILQKSLRLRHRSLHCVLEHRRRVHIYVLSKPVLVLSVHDLLLACQLIWRLRHRVLPVEGHIGVRVGHSVLDGRLLVLQPLALPIGLDVTLQQIERISIAQYRRSMLLLLKIGVVLEFHGRRLLFHAVKWLQMLVLIPLICNENLVCANHDRIGRRDYWNLLLVNRLLNGCLAHGVEIIVFTFIKLDEAVVARRHFLLPAIFREP